MLQRDGIVVGDVVDFFVDFCLDVWVSGDVEEKPPLEGLVNK